MWATQHPKWATQHPKWATQHSKWAAWVIFIVKRQIAIWDHKHFSIKFFWLASTGHISASTEAILKNFMCFQNYSKRSFRWNWSHFSICFQIETTEETRWHVIRAKCQISSKRPLFVKNHKDAIKKIFPTDFLVWRLKVLRKEYIFEIQWPNSLRFFLKLSQVQEWRDQSVVRDSFRTDSQILIPI